MNEIPKTPDKRALRILGRVSDVCFYTFVYTVLHYLLSCCRWAFRHSIASVFFSAMNAFILFHYWEHLKKRGVAGWLRLVLTLLVIAIYIAFVYWFGVLDIGPELKRLP